MAARTTEYEKVEADFLRTAPVHVTLRQRLPVPAAAAFRCLEDGDAWPKWLTAIAKVEWTSSKPWGVGTTRTIWLGKRTVDEHFIAWEEGARMSFRFERGGVPPIKAFAEDYALTPKGDDACELAWTYGFALRGPFVLVQPIFAAKFKRDGVASLARLADLLAQDPSPYQI